MSESPASPPNSGHRRRGQAWRRLRPIGEGLGAALLVAAIAAVTNDAFRTASSLEIEAETVRGLRHVAAAAAAMIDVDRLASFERPEQTSTAEFEVVAAPLRSLCNALRDVKYIYTVRVVGGEVRFVVDSTLPGDADHDGREDQSKVGEVYRGAPPEALRAWRTGAVTWTEQPYTDEWGTFRTLFQPLRNRSGRVTALLGVDMDLAIHRERIAVIDRAASEGTWLAIAAALGVALLVAALRRWGLRAGLAREAALEQLEQARAAAESASAAKSEHIAALEEARARLMDVATGVSGNHGRGFLERMVEVMARSLQADFAMIGHIDDAGQVHTEVNWLDGVVAAPMVHDPRGTPCGKALTMKEPYVVPDGVVSRYPDDAWLRELGMVSYAGCALRDNGGKLLGLVAVTMRKQIAEPEMVASFLSIYAARAATEIEGKRVQADLTRARDQAEAANRSKSEFLANMSHEIRTPLTAILGFAELLHEEMIEGGGTTLWIEQLQTIETNGKALLTIINDILDLAKIEAGKMTVAREACNVDHLAREVVESLRPRAAGRGVYLNYVAATPLPTTIATDSTRLRQVLVNLVGNAIKFTERGSVIVRAAIVGGDDDGPVFRIEVEDTGIGMNQEEMGRLFGAFEQADASTARRFGGTGLGLRISKKLAQLLGGDIEVVSESGRGSTFTLSLPAGNLVGVARSRDGRVGALAAAIDQPLLQGLHLLVVDDQLDNRRLLDAVLKRAGAQVITVDGAEAAYAAVGEPGACAFDAVLLDVQMPGIDGLTAVQELRRRGHRLPILAVTANAMPGARERCLAAGFTGFAAKPIDRKQLIVQVREAIDVVLQATHSRDTAAT